MGKCPSHGIKNNPNVLHGVTFFFFFCQSATIVNYELLEDELQTHDAVASRWPGCWH